MEKQSFVLSSSSSSFPSFGRSLGRSDGRSEDSHQRADGETAGWLLPGCSIVPS